MALGRVNVGGSSKDIGLDDIVLKVTQPVIDFAVLAPSPQYGVCPYSQKDKLMFIYVYNSGVKAYKVSKGGSPTLQWSCPTGLTDNIDGMCLSADETHLYATGAGGTVRINVASGTVVNTTTAYTGKVVAIDEYGNVYVIRTSPLVKLTETLGVIWTKGTSGSNSCGGICCDSTKVYIGSPDFAKAFSLSDGSLVWSNTASGASDSLSIKGELLIAIADMYARYINATTGVVLAVKQYGVSGYTDSTCLANDVLCLVCEKTLVMVGRSSVVKLLEYMFTSVATSITAFYLAYDFTDHCFHVIHSQAGYNQISMFYERTVKA